MRRPIAFFFLIIFGLGLVLAPHIIVSQDFAQKEIKALVEKKLKVRAEFGELTWYWLPLPHVSIQDAKLKGPDFTLDASFVSIYPGLLSILRGRPEIAGIELDDFHFVLKRLRKQESKEQELPGWIRVKNGFFQVSEGVRIPSLPFKQRRLYIKNLYGSLSLSGPSISGHLRGNTRQAESIDIQGALDLGRLSYKVVARISQFDLSALSLKHVTSIKQVPKQIPRYGFVNLELDVEGTGLEWSQGRVEAYSNCFVSKPKAESAIFSCGSLRLSYVFQKDRLDMTIKGLDFQRPHLSLAGSIHLFKKKDVLWAKADLKGRKLDLGQIRQALKALSFKNKDVRDFCTAIRGGKIDWATVDLDGPLSGWHKLKYMYIQGKATDVRVYVKDEDFFVDSASGPFEIKGGVLYAKDVRARLRKTTGTSGRFMFGLSRGKEQFRLDIDLSAPAQDLMWALVKFNHLKRLHDELKGISSLKGHLFGHLRIGDHKHDKKIKVKVEKMGLEGFYDRIGMKVAIKRGRAIYFDKVLTFSEFSGSFGPNSFSGVSGQVSWKSGTIRVKVKKASGRCLAESILALCKRFGLAKDFFKEFRVKASGPFIVKRLRLEFSIDEPHGLTYLVAFVPKGLDLEATLLPMPVRFTKGSFFFTNRRFSATGVRFRMDGRWYQVETHLVHKDLKGWRGTFKSTGRVGLRLWRWIEERGVHLGEFTPRPPFFIKDFVVDFQPDGKTSVKGNMVWKNSQATVFIKARKERNLLDVEDLKISQAGKSCVLRFSIGEGKEPLFFFHFGGELTGGLLKEILLENKLLDGAASGNFTLGFDPEWEKGPYKIEGKGKVSGFHFVWSKAPIAFDSFFLDAAQGSGRFDAVLNIAPDTMGLTGSFNIGKDVLDLRVGLHAQRLSSKTFDRIQAFSDKGTSTTGKVKEVKEESLSDALLSGLHALIRFKIDDLKYSLTDFSKRAQAKDHEISLRNLKGHVEMTGEKLAKMEAYSNDTCGMDIYLKKGMGPNGPFSEFSAITPSGKKARFEDVLDCLGVKQDLITGPLTFNLYLRGKNRVLLGNGHLAIKAKDGFIHRFGLLSKIFSVINIVDIFSLNKGLLEGSSPYKKLFVDANIESGKVHLKKAYIKGQGINFFSTGDVYLENRSLDLIIFVQPLKTVDKIITSLPIIGGIIGGKNESLFAIPVEVSGDWRDPKVRTLPAKTVTDIFKKLIINVITAPFTMKQ